MTMPHLMNCAHSEDGHCLDCVAADWNHREAMTSDCQRLTCQALRNDFDELKSERDYFLAQLRLAEAGES